VQRTHAVNGHHDAASALLANPFNIGGMRAHAAVSARGRGRFGEQTGESTGRLSAMEDSVRPLPLDSPRWGELSTRMGREGEDVRDALRVLTANPSDMWVFREMWPTICSEERTYDAAFAAAPYLVALAEQVPTQEASEFLIVLGLIVTYAGVVPSALEPAYRKATADALSVALRRLADCPIDNTLRYLLAAVAAFRGRTDLASVLQDLDAIQDDCPACGAVVFPQELQNVIERDQAEADRATG
jgi:hypothetical protein